MNIKMIIATHKKYQMPSDVMYLPIHVGKEGKEDIGYQGDNTGDNISLKNSNFCELTGLYWAWKNLNCDYLGLTHYRRHFCLRKTKDKFKSVLSSNELNLLLQDIDVIVPKKRNYYIETVYNHYSHTFHKEDLDTTRKILERRFPKYLKSFDEVMAGKTLHIYNMFVMRKDLADKYCEWLFDVLFELEKELDISNYNAFESRVFGRVSERLLDVWIKTNNVRYREIPVIYMERINWCKKITGFLKAKFFGIKYDKSF